MFLNKLFGNKNTQNVASNGVEVNKNIGYYARKVAMVLGLGAAVSGPVPLQASTDITAFAQKEEVAEVKPVESKPFISEPPVAQEVPVKAPTLKFSKAMSGESVISFMTRSFGVSSGWELLVEKDTGNRVLNPRTDLIAGREYMLARNEKEAISLSAIYKKRDTKIGSTSVEKKHYDVPQKKSKITYNIPHGAFDFSSFLKAISGEESGGKYSADNSKAGEKLKVNTMKHAKGKYQFTNETLANFGYATEAERKHFLKSPELQEKLMYKLTKMNYEYAIKSPVLSKLLDSGVHLTHILASGHHRGIGGTELVAKHALKYENPVEAFFERLEQVKGDWLGKKTSDYVNAVSLKYSQIAQVDITQVNGNLPVHHTEENTQVALMQTPEKTPVKEVSTVASNDDVFDTPVLVTANFTPSQETQAHQPKMIELVDVTPTKPVLEAVRENYKKQLLSKIAQDTSIPLDVRKSIAMKLSKVENIEAYYQEQIDYYNYVLRMSRNDIERQKAKRILPGLQKLLKDTKIIMASSNDESIYRKKAA